MTYKQIEKEFDETFNVRKLDSIAGTGEPNQQIKSFLKQSFIKYLQADIERWTKARTEIQNLQAQIKELEV